MTYRINKTDGNQLVDVPDGTFDTSTTSLTLIGKNVTSFGEAVNENFVKLLENFSSSTAPEAALKGQLWYDTASGRLNVYDGNIFRSAGGPIISPTAPTDLVAGDLWLDNKNNQLWFYDGIDIALAGPIYSVEQGTTGFTTETVLDIFNRSHTIALLYVGSSLLGIFSKDEFTPAQPIVGYSTSIKLIKVGFNVAEELENIKFDVIVTRAENILTSDGELKSASQIVYNDQDQFLVGKLSVQSDDGIVIGASEDVDLKIQSGKFIIEQKLTGQDLGIKTKTPSGTVEAITIDATNTRVGFFTTTPAATVDIQGNLRVAGDLLVEGTQATVNVSILEVEDKNIVLGKTSATPTDTAADGGGITLKGTTDKTFNWVNSSTAWTSSENIDLLSGLTYKIANIDVLSATSLGANVVTSSLTSVGQLIDLQMSGGNTALYLQNNTISNLSGNIVVNSFVNVDFTGSRLISVANPVDEQDAATKNYVDAAVFERGISIGLDITGLGVSPTLEANIAAILDDIAPFYDPVSAPNGVAINGTILRVHCTSTAVTLDPISYTPVEDTGTGGDFSRVDVRDATDTTTESVIKDISTSQTIAAPAATVTVTRVNKNFIMTAGNWAYDIVTGDY